MRSSILTLAVLMPAVLAQQPPSERSIEAQCARLQSQLEPTTGEAPDRRLQIELIGTFLDEHEAARSHPDVLRLRTRLATLLLHSCRFHEAQTQFEVVIDDAAEREEEARDFLGRARYGQAQALELLGQRSDARRALERVLDLHAGERYARFAKVALERLAAPAQTGPWGGRRAPAFGSTPLLDLDERPHQLGSYVDRPLLLVFWSPEVKESIARLRAVAAAWLRGGGTAQTVLAFALSTSPALAARARKVHSLEMPIIVCNDEFVHPVALAYQVTKLPTVVLISPSGTVVGRDLPAAEIERLVRLAQ